MKRLPTIFLLVFLCLAYSNVSAQDKINWLSFPEMEAANAVEAKPVMIDFYTSWCGWCKRMDRTTFSNPEVVEFINKNFYAVKFNAEEKETIKYRGKEFKFIDKGRRGYNELAAGFLQGQMSYPSYVFLNEKLAIITIVKGYQDKKQFMPMITYLGEGHYLTKRWEAFKETWDGK